MPSGKLLVRFLRTGAYFCVITPGTPGRLPDVLPHHSVARPIINRITLNKHDALM